MSFLSGLSNIFHGIGHVLSGGDDEDQKKKDQQQQQQKATPQVITPQKAAPAPAPAQSTPQALAPNLNLTPLQKITPNVAGLKVVPDDNNAPLQKIAPQPDAPVDKGSVGYRLTHNVVTDLAGGIAKQPLGLAKAVIATPTAIAREVQNKPIDDIQQDVFGSTNPTKIAKKIVGDTVGTGLLVGAPGIDSVVEKGASKLLPDAAGAVLQKIAPKVVSGAVQGGAFGATSTAEDGGNVSQTLKSAGVNALVGGSAAGFFAGIPVLAKAVHDGHISPAEADEATKVAEGVHTVNPSRPTDAAAQLGVPAEGPAAPVAPPAAIPPVEPPAPAAIPASAPAPTVAELGNNAARPSGDIQKAIEDAHNAGDHAKAAQLIETLPEDLKAPMRSALGLSEQGAIAPAELPAPKSPKGTVTAENAPGIRQAAEKKLDSLGGNAGDSTVHDVLTNKDFLEAGKAHADTFNDAELVNQYKNGFSPKGAADIAKGHAALDRLNEIAKASPDNADAKNAIDNILSGAEKEFSSGGRTVNYAQQFYDGLQGPAKTSYLIRQIDKVRDAAGMAKLSDDEATMSAATNTIDGLVKSEEALKGKIAAVGDKIQNIKDNPADISRSDAKAQLKDLQKQYFDLQLQAEVQNGKASQYYKGLVPDGSPLEKMASAARTSMLTAPSGRINNTANVTGNGLYELGRNAIQTPLNKVVNLVKGPGTVPDSSLLNSGLITGAKSGLKKVATQLAGNETLSDARSGINSKMGVRNALETPETRGNGLGRKVANVVSTLVKAPSEIIGGAMRDAQVQRLVQQEGEKAGLTGDALKTYTKAGSIVPSRQVLDRGQLLKDQVSHMNKNWLADQVSKLGGDTSNQTGNAKGAVQLMKNTILPFAKYPATWVWNTVTDRNVLAAAASGTKAALSGDIEGVTKAISTATASGTLGYLGYHLTHSGIISNQNAEGFNDAGAYINIGNRHVAIGTLGVGAAGLLAGNAMYNAVNGGGNAADQFVKTILDTVGNTVRAGGAQSLVGEGNQAVTGAQKYFAGKESGADLGAQVGAQAAGQFIPGAFSDVNSVLNNGLGPISSFNNPTHEAALTKVEKTGLTPTGRQSTAKDIGASTVKSLENRIPGLSQTLPRNPGVAAPDFIDRVDRGDRDTSTQLLAKAKAKTQAEISADYTKRGVPDPNGKFETGDSFDNAVENRIEGKKYDVALEGLQAQLKKVQSGKDATTKQTDPIQKQIKTVQVLKNGNYDPAIRDTYKGVTLAEWRDMGDPTSDNYDKAKYEDLYAYDKALAEAGASSSSKDANTPKYSLKDTSASDAKKGAAAAKKAITSNTLRSTPSLSPVDLSSLSLKKISSSDAKLPIIQQIKSGELIKKRQISVGRA